MRMSQDGGIGRQRVGDRCCSERGALPVHSDFMYETLEVRAAQVYAGIVVHMSIGVLDSVTSDDRAEGGDVSRCMMYRLIMMCSTARAVCAVCAVLLYW